MCDGDVVHHDVEFPCPCCQAVPHLQEKCSALGLSARKEVWYYQQHRSSICSCYVRCCVLNTANDAIEAAIYILQGAALANKSEDGLEAISLDIIML